MTAADVAAATPKCPKCLEPMRWRHGYAAWECFRHAGQTVVCTAEWVVRRVELGAATSS